MSLEKFKEEIAKITSIAKLEEKKEGLRQVMQTLADKQRLVTIRINEETYKVREGDRVAFTPKGTGEKTMEAMVTDLSQGNPRVTPYRADGKPGNKPRVVRSPDELRILARTRR